MSEDQFNQDDFDRIFSKGLSMEKAIKLLWFIGIGLGVLVGFLIRVYFW